MHQRGVWLDYKEVKKASTIRWVVCELLEA